MRPFHFLTALFAILLHAAPAPAADAPSTAPASQPGKRLKVGVVAPHFELQSIDGRRFTLDEAKGVGPVVLVVLRGWPGYQCPICTKQVAELISHAKEFEQMSASVVLVYPGPADKLKQHAEEFTGKQNWPKNFTLLLDPDYSFTDAYGLRWNAPDETAYPATFIIQTSGLVGFAKISDSHEGRATFDEIKRAFQEQ